MSPFFQSERNTLKVSNQPNINNLKDQDVSPQIKQVGDDFEAIFLQQMIEKMRSTSELPDEDLLIPRTQSERIYQSLLDSEYARLMSKMGGIGISPLVVEELKRYEQQSLSKDR